MTRPGARRAVRWRVRGVEHPLQSGGARRERLRRRPVGQREYVRRARRAGDARPHVHGARRSAGRRPGRPGRGHQLRLLAAPLRRRGGRHRTIAGRRARDLHDRRRHAARVLRRRRRPDVRYRGADRHRHADQGARRARAAIELVAPDLHPPEAGADRGVRHGATARPAAANSRGDAAERFERRRSGTLHARSVSPRARGDRRLRSPRALPSSAAHADGRRGARAADRVREPREPAAGARLGATPGIQRSPRARRVDACASRGSCSPRACCCPAPARSSASCWRSGAAGCSCARCRPRRTPYSSTCRSTGASSASRRPSR